MKGLHLSQLYYDEVIRQLLEKDFADYVSGIAVGLAGEGSECFGFDDEISRDHDWGVRICLWLTDRDYAQTGQKLQEALLHLPDTFKGYPVIHIPGRCGVIKTGDFFRKYLNTDHPLKTVGEWRSVPEHHLAVASNGVVYTDPLGEFSAIWEDLRLGYPEDIRLKKLAARCMVIGQAGQYNYPRLIKRGDVIAARLALDEFMKGVMSAVHLLNNKYTPFYKWMFHSMKKLPVLGNEMGELLLQLSRSEMKQDTIEEICCMLISEFQRQGISDEKEHYMVVQGQEVQNHIKFVLLRQTDPWLE